MYRGEYTAREISIYTKHLPRGGAVGEFIGGPDAITAEQEDLWVVQHLLAGLGWQNAGSKGPAPKMRDYPKGWSEQQSTEQKMLSQAEAFARKHHNK